jgi:hypothetical protein
MCFGSCSCYFLEKYFRLLAELLSVISQESIALGLRHVFRPLNLGFRRPVRRRLALRSLLALGINQFLKSHAASVLEVVKTSLGAGNLPIDGVNSGLPVSGAVVFVRAHVFHLPM